MSSSGKTFGPTKRLADAYAKGLHQIIGRVLTPKLPEMSLEDWLQSLAERSQQADIQEASTELARRMFSWANISNARTWREAAAKSQKSRQLYAYLQKELTGTPTGHRVNQLIVQNANYISSLPLDAARTLVNEVTKTQQSGARAGTVAKMMRSRFPILLRSRVHLISRTETAKASLALTQARCEDIGIQFAQWATSEDVRVRTSHRKMDKVIFAWNDLPDPEALAGEKHTDHYGPGGIYNCRCTSMPVLDVDDIHFPAKVHHHGSVTTMGKQAFLKTFGITAHATTH